MNFHSVNVEVCKFGVCWLISLFFSSWCCSNVNVLLFCLLSHCCSIAFWLQVCNCNIKLLLISNSIFCLSKRTPQVFILSITPVNVRHSLLTKNVSTYPDFLHLNSLGHSSAVVSLGRITDSCLDAHMQTFARVTSFQASFKKKKCQCDRNFLFENQKLGSENILMQLLPLLFVFYFWISWCRYHNSPFF